MKIWKLNFLRMVVVVVMVMVEMVMTVVVVEDSVRISEYRCRVTMKLEFVSTNNEKGSVHPVLKNKPQIEERSIHTEEGA